MSAVSANVSGQIGSVVAGGLLLALVPLFLSGGIMTTFNAALQVSAYGLGGIFGFMLLFYGCDPADPLLVPEGRKTTHHEER